MSDTPMPGDRHDRDVNSILNVATIGPTNEFRAQLHAELTAEADHTVNVVSIVPLDDRPSRRRLWPILGAAAAIVMIVTIAIVSGRDGDGSLNPADPDSIETRTTDQNALTGDALASELAGRRWYALERFDTSNPTVLTPSFLVSGPGIFDSHDGCNQYGAGEVSFDGSTIRFTPADDSDAEDCGVGPLLRVEAGQHIELLAGADSFLLRDNNGTPLARFTDLASLEPATPDLFQFGLYVDNLGFVNFSSTGRGFTDCTQLAWEEVDAKIVVTLADDGMGCGGDATGYKFTDVTVRLRNLTDTADGSTGAVVYRTASGLLLTNEGAAIELRTIDPTPIQQDRATLGAGAIFGVQPAVGVSPDDVIAAVAPHLGAPDHDTDWLDRRNADLEPIQTCGLNNYREIMWGDLVTTFWQSGSRTVFLSWHVGDDRAELLRKPDANRPEPVGASNVVTEHNVRVGDAATLIPDRFNLGRMVLDDGADGVSSDTSIERVTAISPNPAATPGSLAQSTFRGNYLVDDGTVVAFGSELLDC